MVCMLQKTDNMEKTADVWKFLKWHVEINLQYLVWRQEEPALCLR